MPCDRLWGVYAAVDVIGTGALHAKSAGQAKFQFHADDRSAPLRGRAQSQIKLGKSNPLPNWTALASLVRFDQFRVADTDGLREFVEGDDGRVALTSLQTAQILLAEARPRLDLFLCEALGTPQA